MSKRFDAKKHRAVSYYVSGYQFPAAKPMLGGFCCFKEMGRFRYENQKKTNHRIFNQHGHYVNGYRTCRIHLHELCAVAKFYGIMWAVECNDFALAVAWSLLLLRKHRPREAFRLFAGFGTLKNFSGFCR